MLDRKGQERFFLWDKHGDEYVGVAYVGWQSALLVAPSQRSIVQNTKFRWELLRS